MNTGADNFLERLFSDKGYPLDDNDLRQYGWRTSDKRPLLPVKARRRLFSAIMVSRLSRPISS